MLALLGLFFLAPVFAVICLVIRIKMGSPIFYKQNRIGLNGKPFVLLKFRSMLNLNDSTSSKFKNEKDRITAVGRFLRSTSLDELPQLLNILKGDMSFVGPRPLLPEYLPLYNSHQSRRHRVRPGLTGWAQINGRNAQTWEQRFDLDVWYVENQTFWLDLKIFCLTFERVLKRDGVNTNDNELMSPFRGSPT